MKIKTCNFLLFTTLMIMAIVSCEKDKDNNDTGKTVNDTTQQDSIQQDTIQNDTIHDDTTGSGFFDGTTWYVEQSITVDGKTTEMYGEMKFTSGGKFSYGEKIVKQGEGVTLELIDSISGTYTYTGSPNVEDNLSFKYKDQSAMDVISKSKYLEVSGSGLIWLTVNGLTRELSPIDTTNSEGEPTILDNTTWNSNTFYYSTFQQDVSITLFFKSNGLCTIQINKENGSMSSDATYTVDNNTVNITYEDFSFASQTSSGTISGDQINISLYGEVLIFDKQ